MTLGDLQQLVMLAVARLGKEAYGAAIRDELRQVAGRSVAVSTVYVTLVRLEERGMVESSEAPREAGEGGRARRVFSLTPAGWRSLSEARDSAQRMWKGVVQP